jgi:Zn-dependent peptidase ImmA (M78 family)
VAVAFNCEIERLFALPEADVPDLARRKAPEWVAERLRSKWELGEQPIESMVQLLEGKGVRVFSLPADAVDAGTFSLWHRNQPFVFLDATKSQIERRLDLARELGHLLMHRHQAPAGPKAQQAANRFAANFLMPRAAMPANPPHAPTLCAIRNI